MTHLIVNLVAYQVAWLANVIGAGHGLPWLGPPVTIAWIALHLRALPPGRRAGEARLVAASALIGYAFDSALVLGGLLSFPAPAHLGGPSPIWMVALWAGFALTLRHCLSWLHGRPVLAAVLGAIGGPLAYLGGAALGGLALHGRAGLAAVAVEWLISMPLLYAVADRLDARRDDADVASEPETSEAAP